MADEQEPNAESTREEIETAGQGAADSEVTPPAQPQAPNPFQNFPADAQHVIQQAFALVSGPMRSPFWESFGPEHMTTFLEGQDREADRAFADRQRDRLFQGFLFVAALIFVLVIVVLAVFGDVREILPTIVVGMLAFGSGFAAGSRFRR